MWNRTPSHRRPKVEDDSPLLAPKLTNAAPRILVSMGRFAWLQRKLTRFAYVRLIHRAGGRPMWVDYGDGFDQKTVQKRAREIVSQGDGLLLSGGGDVDSSLYGGPSLGRNVDIRRDRFELALLEEAACANIPVLGICRGCQLLNVSRGGTLVGFRSDSRKTRIHNRLAMHRVTFADSCRISNLLDAPKRLKVRSLHGQAIAQPGTDLHVVGWSRDGTVEAIECQRDREENWVVGIQWHPELTLFANDEHRLIQAFVNRAKSSA